MSFMTTLIDSAAKVETKFKVPVTVTVSPGAAETVLALSASVVDAWLK